MQHQKKLPKTVLNLLDDFADIYLLGEKNRKPLTIKAYVADVKRYLLYLQPDDDAVLNITVNGNLFQQYLVYLRKQDMEDSTVSRRLSGLIAFWKFLYKRRMAPPVMDREDMDIEITYERNPTRRISDATSRAILKGAYDFLEKNL